MPRNEPAAGKSQNMSLETLNIVKQSLLVLEIFPIDPHWLSNRPVTASGISRSTKPEPWTELISSAPAAKKTFCSAWWDNKVLVPKWVIFSGKPTVWVFIHGYSCSRKCRHFFGTGHRFQSNSWAASMNSRPTQPSSDKNHNVHLQYI